MCQESGVRSQESACCLLSTALCLLLTVRRWRLNSPRPSSPYISRAICLPFSGQMPANFLPVGAIFDVERLNFLPVGSGVIGIAGLGSPRAQGKGHGGGVWGGVMGLRVRI